AAAGAGRGGDRRGSSRRKPALTGLGREGERPERPVFPSPNRS
ncbi:hypothetical protein CSUI_010250, partial [Cystoisospora suis]